MSQVENCHSEIHDYLRTNLNELDTLLSNNDYRNFDLSDIYQELSTDSKSFISQIDIETQKKYFYCLDHTYRWVDHIFSRVTSTFVDSDYDHVLGMLKINSEIKKLNLSSVNHFEVEQMIILHDGGEIITKDMSSNHPDSRHDFVSKIKKIEPKAFCRFVLAGLEDGQSRQVLTNLYRQYEGRFNNPQDTNSHLVKMIDMIQGDNFGLENVYQKEIINTAYPDISHDAKLSEILEGMKQREIEQSQIVLDSLKTPEDKDKFSEYMRANFTKFQ